MIKFEEHILKNGLTVIIHQDKSTPIAAVNLMYNVGSKHESSNRTGFAHLFEHLMFEGSEHIPSYDTPLQLIGGQNNAFTSTDVTNYYVTLPKENLETAFWLESDRMLNLAFSEESLRVQKNVVMEEFKQRYLNQPYGDMWLNLRPLAFKQHPYRWATIGESLTHIEEASLNEVKDFFNTHYNPHNAVLVVAGDLETENVLALAEKWFGSIEKPKRPTPVFPTEPKQTERRTQHKEVDVPQPAIYMAWHIVAKTDPEFPAVDLVSDVLSRGDSSRFTKNLIKGKQLFSELDAYVTGEIEPGLFVIGGKLSEGVSLEQAEVAIWEEINEIKVNGITTQELTKVVNKVESTLAFGEMDLLNKSMNLAFACIQGDTNMVNTEIEKYLAVRPEEVQEAAKQYLGAHQVSVLTYQNKTSA